MDQAEDRVNSPVQITTGRTVGNGRATHATILDGLLSLLRLAGLIWIEHSKGVAALLLYKPKAGNVSVAVADKNHVWEQDLPLIMFDKGIQCFVVSDVEGALVDAEQDLGLVV